MKNKNNVVNKKGTIPGKSLSGVSRLYGRLVNRETTLLYQQRISGRSRIKCGMTNLFNNGSNGFTPALVIPVLAVRAHAGYSAGYKSGFTLIELLVVVLIIGILAAVAVPQYQKAVWKSRATQLYTDVQALKEAQQAYYMANGTYATRFDELAVEPNFNQSCPQRIQTTFVTATDCRANQYSVTFIVGGSIYAIFHQGPYEHGGFVVNKEDLRCYENIRNKFCSLMGYNTFHHKSGSNYYYEK